MHSQLHLRDGGRRVAQRYPYDRRSRPTSAMGAQSKMNPNAREFRLAENHRSSEANIMRDPIHHPRAYAPAGAFLNRRVASTSTNTSIGARTPSDQGKRHDHASGIDQVKHGQKEFSLFFFPSIFDFSRSRKLRLEQSNSKTDTAAHLHSNEGVSTTTTHKPLDDSTLRRPLGAELAASRDPIEQKTKAHRQTPVATNEAASSSTIKTSSSSTRPQKDVAAKEVLKSFASSAKQADHFSQVVSAWINCSLDLPSSMHWRGTMLVAAEANRRGLRTEARRYHEKSCSMSPREPAAWGEWAKFEDDCGEWEKCRSVLEEGLRHCPRDEPLLIRTVKHEEKMGNLEGARRLIAPLRQDGDVSRVWKCVMEGAMVEARAGNTSKARSIFSSLIDRLPKQGALYAAYCKMELRIGMVQRSMSVCENGLYKCPSYGPLWFLALQLTEIQGSRSNLSIAKQETNMKIIANRSQRCVSRHSLWRVHFYIAQAAERRNQFPIARRSFTEAVNACPKHKLWSVWIATARMELCALIQGEHTEREKRKQMAIHACKLLARALECAPAKAKAQVLLESARAQELLGNVEQARALIHQAKRDSPKHWKAWLGAILLEVRMSNMEGAIAQAVEALDAHPTIGRLWAVRIQLARVVDGAASMAGQLALLERALAHVPKSGEVWCEAARIALLRGQVDKARAHLRMAIGLTPQYGDSVVEAVRMELMRHPAATSSARPSDAQSDAKSAMAVLKQTCANADPNYGVLWLKYKRSQCDLSLDVLEHATRELCASRGQRFTGEYLAGLSTKGKSDREKFKLIFAMENYLNA